MTTGPIPTFTRASVAVNPETGEQVAANPTHWGRGGGGRFVPGGARRVRPALTMPGVSNTADLTTNFNGGYTASDSWTFEMWLWLDPERPDNNSHFIGVGGSEYLRVESDDDIGMRTGSAWNTWNHQGDVVEGEWFHISLSHEGDTTAYRMVVNGVDLGVRDNGNAWSPNYFSLFGPYTSTTSWRGGISQFRLWDHVRSVEQTQKYKDVRIIDPLPGLARNIPFEMLGDGAHKTPELIAGTDEEIQNGDPFSGFMDGPPLATKALLIEEGTTNLLNEAQSKASVVDNHPVGWQAHNTAVASVVASPWPASSVMEFEGDGTQSQPGVQASFPPSATDATVTFSVWVKPPSSEMRILLRDDAASNTWYSENMDDLIPGVWQRVIRTLTPPPGLALSRVYMRDYNGAANVPVRTFSFGKVQVEEKPYATSWQPGGTVREAEGLTSGLVLGTRWSGHMAFYVDNAIHEGTRDHPLVAAMNGEGSGFRRQIWVRLRDGLQWIKNDGSGMTKASIADGWHLMSWEVFDNEFSWWLDGEHKQTATDLNVVEAEGLLVGYNHAGGYYWPTVQPSNERLGTPVSMVAVRSDRMTLSDHQALWNDGAILLPERDANTLALYHWDTSEVSDTGGVQAPGEFDFAARGFSTWDMADIVGVAEGGSVSTVPGSGATAVDLDIVHGDPVLEMAAPEFGGNPVLVGDGDDAIGTDTAANGAGHVDDVTLQVLVGRWTELSETHEFLSNASYATGVHRASASLGATSTSFSAGGQGFNGTPDTDPHVYVVEDYAGGLRLWRDGVLLQDRSGGLHRAFHQSLLGGVHDDKGQYAKGKVAFSAGASSARNVTSQELVELNDWYRERFVNKLTVSMSTTTPDLPSQELVAYPDLLTHGQFFADTFSGDDRGIEDEGQWIDSSQNGPPDIVSGRLIFEDRSRLAPVIQSNYLNTDVLAKIRCVDATSVYGWHRFDEWSPTSISRPVNGVGFRVYGSPGSTSVVYLYRSIENVVTQIGSKHVHAVTPFDSDFWVRCRVAGNQLMVRVWSDGEIEPSAWDLTSTAELQSAGKFGLNNFGGGAEIDEFYLSDITTISDPGGIPSQEGWEASPLLIQQTVQAIVEHEGSAPSIANVQMKLAQVGAIATEEAVFDALASFFLTMNGVGGIETNEAVNEARRVAFELPYEATIKIEDT